MDLVVDGSHCGRYRDVSGLGHLKTAFKIIERKNDQPAASSAVLNRADPAMVLTGAGEYTLSLADQGLFCP